jgi:phospholipid/cholesterol/gamma-HCH transport system substrate-binding protein
MSWRLAVKRYSRATVAIVSVMALGTIATLYILIHERLPVPFQTTYSLSAEFTTADSAAGGEGLPVTVAGVQVGTIKTVTARDGYALVQMAIQPSVLPRVYANASANLVPDTPLKDMEVRLAPGGPPARPLPHGATIPLANTQSPIDLDQLLASLDTDTREYLASLVSGAAVATNGRGRDIRSLLEALGPTTQEASELGSALAGRRTEIAQLVHNLMLVARAAGASDDQLAEVVDAGDATLSALSSQDAALSDSLSRLPGTLSTARTTLGNVTGLSDLLGPTLTALEPAVQKLPAALGALGPLVQQATPIVRDELRPLVKKLQPLAANVAPAVRDLDTQTPDLMSAFQVLHYVSNETGYHSSSWPGFLFWTAWAAHDADSAFSTEDANGAAPRAILLASCQTLTGQPEIGALLEALLDINPAC